MKRIIALYSSGPGAGKTTVAQMIKQQRSSFHVLSFAANPRAMLKRLLLDVGIEQQQVEILSDQKKDEPIEELNGQTFRQVLIALAEGGKTRLGDTLWADLVKKKIDESPADLFVIDDLRFNAELDVLLTYPARFWNIERTPEDDFQRQDNFLQDQIEPEIVISNDGSLAALQIQVANALTYFEADS